MAYNVFKPRGSTKASKPDAGGAVLRSTPVFGVVKDNIDPIRSGRLRVYVSDMGGTNPDDDSSWVTVNYMSPFYGTTEGSGPKNDYGSYLTNPVSYGMWNSPPDIGTTVICIFVNGDPNYGYWIGCAPDPAALHMVPAIGANFSDQKEQVILNSGEANSYGGATRLPVTNMNTNNEGLTEKPDFIIAPKPVHSYLAGILSQQGLLRDSIRGPIGSSAQRESPSRVGWGVNTPGRPIYEGGFTDETIADAAGDSGQQSGLKVISRRSGHSIVMDDGDLIGRDQLIRLRSSLGHQILMSDDGQTIHIIHANGQSWVELGKEGTIDMYATNSVNIRTQGDLNLHADNNININAKKDLNIYGENVNIESDKKTNHKIGTDYSAETTGKHTTKVGDRMSFESKGDASVASSAITYINGSKINLNTGSTSLVPQAVKPLSRVAHTDTMFDQTKGWAAAPGALISVVSRAPAHAPWANANQGVDVKVSNDAAANFPSPPSSAVAAANQSLPPATQPVPPAVVSTVPAVGAVSKAIDTNTTTAMVGQVATMAQTNSQLKTAVAVGTGAIPTPDGAVAVVGKMAMTPQQMETAGVIKAGAAPLVNSLVAGGKTVAENLKNFVANPAAQVQAQVTNFQKAQTQLTSAGIITGKESAGQLGGLVTSTATVGLAGTVNAVKNAAGALGAAISGPVSALGSAANKLLGSSSSMISSGNFAANMASTVTGGLSSIASSLSGMGKNLLGTGNKLASGVGGLLDSAKGVAGSAFAAITKSFPTLAAGKPQDIKKIADEAVAKAQSAGTPAASDANNIAGALQNAGTSLAKTATGAASSLVPGGSTLLSSATSLVTSATKAVTGAVNSVVSGVTSTVASITKALSPSAASTGLGALPGSSSAVATVVNKATGALNVVPGTAQLTGAIKQLSASINTGSIGNASSILNKLKEPGTTLQSLASTGLPTAQLAEFNSAISSLSSGGAVPIKLPTVAVGTSDRSSITSQLGSVFGSTKIPLPNFSGNPASVGDTAGSSALAENQKRMDDMKEATAKLLEANKEVRIAKAAYYTAKNNLPAGDPQIEELKEKWASKVAEADIAVEEAKKFT
jgi:hypothetical protein